MASDGRPRGRANRRGRGPSSPLAEGEQERTSTASLPLSAPIGDENLQGEHISAQTLGVIEEGQGPRVVLVHGFTQTGGSWRPLVQQLARTHDVVSVDAPGHGRSAAVRAGLWDGCQLLGDAGGVADYVGYSMGGRLCLHLALTEPALVRTLVLIGATGGIDDAGERAERRAADERLARRLEADGLEAFLDQWLAQPLFAGLSGAAADLDARRENTVAGLASSLRLAGTGSQDPLWDRLGELAMPVLVVTGERDTKFGALGERMVAAIGPNADLRVIAGAGHAVQLEAPGRFLDVLDAFWTEHRPAGT